MNFKSKKEFFNDFEPVPSVANTTKTTYPYVGDGAGFIY